MAQVQERTPLTLYSTALAVIARQYYRYEKELETIQTEMQFDVFYQLYKDRRYNTLKIKLSDLEVFRRLLRVRYKRNSLHRCIQGLMDSGFDIANDLVNSYLYRCSQTEFHSTEDKTEKLQFGFAIWDFLSDGGWHQICERLSEGCFRFLNHGDDRALHAENLFRLIHSRTSLCKFELAEKTFQEMKSYFWKLSDCYLTELYAEAVHFHLARHNYKEAYRWSVDGLKTIHTCMSPKAAVSLMRHAAKACVHKREYRRAKMLIEQSMVYCRLYCGHHTPLMAKTLLDYGLYLLNIDSVPQAAIVYETALTVWHSIFAGRNLHIAVTHSDLAYCHYMLEYSSGRFHNADKHSDRAISMFDRLLPPNHLLIASAKRVKALIYEEIAIEIPNQEMVNSMLHTSFDLLWNALKLAERAYGEVNIQTAKYYANLGRLYQSMKLFEEAKQTHLRAISIKEKLLDRDDYEVSLSISHLASLYNYDLNLFREAEALYLRSIESELKTFGKCHNGLKYDYSGLVRVYQNLNDAENMNKYMELLNEWMVLRREKMDADRRSSPLDVQSDRIPYNRIYSSFLELL